MKLKPIAAAVAAASTLHIPSISAAEPAAEPAMHLVPRPTSAHNSRRLTRKAARHQAVRDGVILGDTHSNLNEGKGSGSFTEPLYYSGHKEKLEAMIDLFATRGDPLVAIHLNRASV